jgi:hypothetical protein
MDRHLSDDVLFAYSVEPSHDRQTLENYLRQYPELAEELVDLSHEFNLAKAVGPSDVEVKPDAGWEAAWQQYSACGPPAEDTAMAVNPFLKFKGPEFVFLANTLKVPRSILTALRDRLVNPTSIPLHFLRRFSESTRVSIDMTRQYFSLPPIVSDALSYKADNKPSVQEQVTFESLVLNSSLTDEQREALQRDLEDNGCK